MLSTTACCFLSYRFNAPAFGFSILLPISAAWLLTKDFEKRNERIISNVISIIFLAIGLGAYQPSFGCFFVIVIFMFMQFLVNGDEKKGYSLFCRCFLSACSACIIYKIIWDIVLKFRGISAADYNGANSISVIKILMNIPVGIIRAYYAWFEYFLLYNGNYVFKIARITLYFFLIAIVIIVGVRKLVKKPKILFLYLLAYACVPVGANIAFILAPGNYGLMWQMTGALSIITTVKLCFLDNHVSYSKVITVISAIFLYGNILAVGTDIDAMVQGNNSMRTVMSNVVTSMIKEDVFNTEFQYAFIGDISGNELFSKNSLWDSASDYAKAGKLWVKPDCMINSYIGLLDDMGLNLNIVDIATYEEILRDDHFANMPVYPQNGSIIERNGVVVVKVSNNY
ncbi:glucosyltransferase domain-containing protein [Butyrivibrio sp. AC2005]|uniref:glucosyltransferase domain-containing protein n=1 Tax=Butyrivibrio sp. AC2005 TaxID=1280672 RepID=UPI000417B13B